MELIGHSWRRQQREEGGMSGSVVLPDVLTHYYRPFSRPLLSLSALAN